MNKAELVSKATLAFGKTKFKLQKHSPEILIVTGIVGTVVSAVMACKATLSVPEIVEEHKDALNEVHENPGNLPVEQIRKETAMVFVRTGAKFVKVYAPSVILGSLSIASILASNDILRKRNVALGAAYATLNQSFNEYRNRVIERFGDKVDKELKYGLQTKKVETTEVDPETGKEKKKKEAIEISSGVLASPYAKFFDESSRCWEKDAELNLMFLRREQAYWNDKLRARGYVFLNEVYERLDIPTTRAGQCVGWIYNPDRPNGDNYIDFGMYDITREPTRDFVNGLERVILLDFNVDGVILDKIEENQW